MTDPFIYKLFDVLTRVVFAARVAAIVGALYTAVLFDGYVASLGGIGSENSTNVTTGLWNVSVPSETRFTCV